MQLLRMMKPSQQRRDGCVKKSLKRLHAAGKAPSAAAHLVRGGVLEDEVVGRHEETGGWGGGGRRGGGGGRRGGGGGSAAVGRGCSSLLPGVSQFANCKLVDIRSGCSRDSSSSGCSGTITAPSKTHPTATAVLRRQPLGSHHQPPEGLHTSVEPCGEGGDEHRKDTERERMQIEMHKPVRARAPCCARPRALPPAHP